MLDRNNLFTAVVNVRKHRQSRRPWKLFIWNILPINILNHKRLWDDNEDSSTLSCLISSILKYSCCTQTFLWMPCLICSDKPWGGKIGFTINLLQVAFYQNNGTMNWYFRTILKAWWGDGGGTK